MSARQGLSFIGSIDQEVNFCPWCGADKRKPDELMAAAQHVVEALDKHKEWGELKDAIASLADVLEKQKG